MAEVTNQFKALKTVAEAVKTRLVERGWTKGLYEDPDGACCLVGGVRAILPYDYGYEGSLYDLLADCIPKAFRTSHATLYEEDVESFLIEYNDDSNRTFEEITTVLDCAIERAVNG